MPLVRLGQTGDASSEVTLFTVTPGTYTYVTARSLIVCNRSGAAATFQVAHNTGGGATAVPDFWFYATPLVPNQSLLFPLDAGLIPGDTLKVQASSANVTFNLYGETS